MWEKRICLQEKRTELLYSGRLQKTRVSVFYCSKTGNTKKVAKAIAEEFGVEALEAPAVGSGYDLKKTDLIFVGSGNYKSAPANEMVEFLKALLPAKNRYAVVFGTAGGNSRLHMGKMRKLLEDKGVKVLGEWCCPGQEYDLKHKGRPNSDDLEEARKFAKKELKKIEVL